MTRTSPLLVLLVVLALLASACGAAEDSSAEPVPTTSEPDSGSDVGTGDSTSSSSSTPDSTGSTSTPSSPSTAAPEGGWIDGEPEWLGDGGAAAEGALSVDAAEADVDSAASTEPPLTTTTVAAKVGEDGRSVPLDGPQTDPLRAGSVDDNADYQGFLSYLDRVEDFGIRGRPFDATGRTVLTVVGSDGLPIAGLTVDATVADAETVSLTTTADGTIRFFAGPASDDDGVARTIRFDVDGTPVETQVGLDVGVELERASGLVDAAPGDVPLDVLFLLDATGSMSDEIDRLKTTIDSVAEQINALEPRPDVRFAMTLYRDTTDTFVTSTFDFTGDLDQFRDALGSVVADGGGDTPEALDEALAAALSEPQWRAPAEAVQLVFLVADAPPQIGRDVQVPYTASITEAASRGITIFPVASSETDDTAELVFRQIALATGAPFVFLTYGAGGAAAATGPSTDINPTDYETLALDQLVVRLIAEEIAVLSGKTPVALPPPSSTTTVPDGQ